MHNTIDPDVIRDGHWTSRQAGTVRAKARAKNVDHSYVSRTNGDIETKSLQHVRDLARGEETSPAVWLETLNIEHRRAAMEHKPVGWLVARFHDVRDSQLPANELAAQVAARDGNRLDERQARTIAASLQRELVAIDKELERRGITPADYTKEGRLKPLRP